MADIQHVHILPANACSPYHHNCFVNIKLQLHYSKTFQSHWGPRRLHSGTFLTQVRILTDVTAASICVPTPLNLYSVSISPDCILHIYTSLTRPCRLSLHFSFMSSYFQSHGRPVKHLYQVVFTCVLLVNIMVYMILHYFILIEATSTC